MKIVIYLIFISVSGISAASTWDSLESKISRASESWWDDSEEDESDETVQVSYKSINGSGVLDIGSEIPSTDFEGNVGVIKGQQVKGQLVGKSVTLGGLNYSIVSYRGIFSEHYTFGKFWKEEDDHKLVYDDDFPSLEDSTQTFKIFDVEGTPYTLFECTISIVPHDESYYSWENKIGPRSVTIGGAKKGKKSYILQLLVKEDQVSKERKFVRRGGISKSDILPAAAS